MNEGTRSHATSEPWRNPASAPSASVAGNARASGQPALTDRIAAIPPRSPAIAPTERSISPVTMTMTMPTARSEVTDICRARSARFLGLTNVPWVVTRKTAQMTARAPMSVSAFHGRARLLSATFKRRTSPRP